MALKYLITGATGGLGKHVLNYFVENVPFSEFAAASSNPQNKSKFEDRGIAFRHVNYDDPQSLETGLRDVENLLFVSSSGYSRGEQHSNVINAAKKAGVKHVWYTSLAFGGFSDDSKAPVQQDHLLTEKLLRESGLTYTSIREGIYAEAFTVFLDWYPKKTTVTLPADGEVAFTSRPELGEATARIMIRGGYENQIVLFTAEETITAKELVDVINDSTGRQVKLNLVSPEEYLDTHSIHDQRGKPREHFEWIATVWDEITKGSLRTIHPLMHEILGREPTKPRDAVRKLLTDNRDYTFL
ncbi:hypothetical protein BDV24DRAFT_135763 [Aspergillus arachidicola]|uniref:NmrA-like family protein n=1 Tax=Aspergillus arachidicola TaxID=656916 RepID=A0A2G7FF99_9EURO|nr:hypothetical protein BDV24DRAFT_135763 [Aspergillus arachidicola]PIG79278.1 nmrA-like family protein [Aspergillus arachidicola]